MTWVPSRRVGALTTIWIFSDPPDFIKSSCQGRKICYTLDHENCYQNASKVPSDIKFIKSNALIVSKCSSAVTVRVLHLPVLHNLVVLHFFHSCPMLVYILFCRNFLITVGTLCNVEYNGYICMHSYLHLCTYMQHA